MAPTAPPASPATADPRAAFAKLDAGLPLLLLPVRIETCFVGAGAAAELRIRILPDRIHTDAHSRRLSPTEVQLGTAMWNRLWARPADPALRTDALRWLARRLGPWRAAWVARTLAPTNLSARIGGATAAPTFPATPTATTSARGRVRLMPDRWAAIGFVAGDQVFCEFGVPVAADLALGLDPAAEVDWTGGKVDPALRWLVDYDQAVRVGMAITIGLTGARASIATGGLDTLWVLGVAESRGAAELASVLESHHYTSGIDFLATGTATNNTDNDSSGYRRVDPAVIAERELPPSPPPSAAASANAAVLARALGLPDASLLHRLPHGADTDEAQASAMNRVVWHGTIGALVDRLLSGTQSRLVSKPGVAWLESWFVDRVRAAGPLPIVRLGNQPYGILPARSAPPPTTWPANADTDTLGRLWIETLVDQLTPTWDAARAAVPRLDPDQLGSTSPDDALVDFLATSPDPARFTVRTLEEKRDDVILIPLVPIPIPYGVISSYDGYLVTLRTAYAGQSEFLAKLDALPREVHDIDQQLAFFRELTRTTDVRWQILSSVANPSAATQTQIDNLAQAKITLGAMTTMLALHKERVDPLRRFAPGVSGRVGADEPTILYSLYATEGTPWAAPLVQARTATDGNTAASYLQWLADRATTAGTVAVSTTQPPGLTDERPLLYQLAREAVLRSADAPSPVGGGPSAQARVKNALAQLVPVPFDRLGQRLRETLGLSSHRLDAWWTSVASSRLDGIRTRTPTGLAIGGWGHVMDLRPDPPRDRTSGFIHAPSLGQAATAAVLRSGWLAHQGDDPAPYAVDLRSGRVRRAAWLLDAARAGRSFADVLGYQFERALHDAVLDGWIADFRKATGARRAGGTVDGLRLWEDKDGPTIKALRQDTRLSATQKAALEAAIGDVGVSIDAVADATLAESVHQVVTGNVDRASATLRSISTGDVPPPVLELPRTPRAGIDVTHRVLVLLTDAAATTAWPGSAASPRALACPALETWAAALLGDPRRIGATFVPGDGSASKPVSVADLTLGALDFAWLCPPGEEAEPRALLACLAAWQASQPTIARRPGRFDLEQFAGITLADALVLGRALRALVARSRRVVASDFAIARGSTPDGVQAAALQARASAALGAAEAAASTLEAFAGGGGDPAKLCAAIGALAGIGPYSGDPARPADTGVFAMAARARIAAAKEIADAAKRLSVLLHTSVPVPFVTADAAALGAAWAASAARAPDGAAMSWLGQMARIRAGSSRLHDALSFADALGDTTCSSVGVIQVPHVAGEEWAATSLPPASRLSIVVAAGGGLTIAANRPLCGLMVDELVDRVPSSRQATGLAVSYDAPAARPPQTWLLAVTPGGTPWSFDQVLATVRDTMTWAKRRAVAPDDLEGLGHYLPAAFTSVVLDPGKE